MNRWAIAVACAFINCLIIGGARLTPLLFVASMDRYSSNRQNASFAYVLCFLVRTLIGPAIGYFGRKYGLSEATLFGCIVASVGLGGCYFAEDIIAVTVLWGVLYGAGLGLSTALLPTILFHHFQSEGTLANGVALAGSSLGALILPVIFQSLLNTYGLSGSQLILSAIFLNSVPAALLLKMSLSDNLKNKNSTINSTNSNCPNENCPKKDLQYVYSSETSTLKTQVSPNDIPKGQCNPAFNLNDDNINSYNTYKDISLTPVPIDRRSTFLRDIFLKRGHKLVISNHNAETRRVSGAPVLLNVFNLYSNVSTFQDKTSPSAECIPTAQPPESKSKFRPFRIFCDPTFMTIMVTQSLYSFVTTIVWTIIFDYVRDKGIDDDQGVYFVMFLPASDVVGRLGLAWVTDKGHMTRGTFGCLCFVAMGIGRMLMVWSRGFVFIMSAEIVSAFFSGGLMALLPGVINEIMDSEDKTMAMASRHVLYAPLSLLISPLIGYFRGTLGSYDGILYLTSGMCFVCGGLMLVVPLLVQRKNRKQ